MSALTSTPTRSASAERADRPAEPIVAAIDASAASRAAIDEAVSLAAELDAPLVFAYVRRAPAGVFGSPVYQQRLTIDNERARRVLDGALQIANTAEVEAEAEVRPDRGQRDVHHRDVEDQHELRGAEQRERQPAARLGRGGGWCVGDRCGVAHGCSARCEGRIS